MALWKLYLGDAHYGCMGYDGLQAIRLTILGRYALGLTDTYQARTRDEETRS